MVKNMNVLEVKDLHVSVEGKEILKGVNLVLELGKVTALMGPNGSGKSTLANTLAGHPKYEVTSGQIIFNGEDITHMKVDERSKKGLFLSFQYPSVVPGITIANFLRTALNARRDKDDKISPKEFKEILDSNMSALQMDKKFLLRYLNDGFSGGEKKRAEILQLGVLNPTLAVLDETDSGLDIDALRIVSEGVNRFMKDDKAILVITHYKRILEYLKPERVVILVDGKIVKEGDASLVDNLEENGYAWIFEE